MLEQTKDRVGNYNKCGKHQDQNVHCLLESPEESCLLGLWGLAREAFSKLVHHLSSLMTVLVFALKVQRIRKHLRPGKTGKTITPQKNE